MDTPERNQIAAPISKFEDSPVFNFINSLSPIKPVKSAPIAQTFNSLSFVSLPSIFASPHVSSHKESRFLRRHNFSDPSKPESSSVNGNKDRTNEETVDADQLCVDSVKPPEDFDPRSSIRKSPSELNDGQSEPAIELPQALKYGCASPGCEPTSCGDIDAELASKSASLVLFSEEASETGRLDGELHLKGICQIEQQKEEANCDWESLISDAADLLIFDSPDDTRAFKGLIQKSLDPGTSACASLGSQLSQDGTNDLQTREFVGSDESREQYETDGISTQPEEANKLNGMDQSQEILANTSFKNSMGSNASGGEMDSEGGARIPVPSKTLSNLHRGMRRRCLVFEMAGVRRKNMDDESNCSSSTLPQSDGKFVSNDKQLVPPKHGNDSFRRILPGIGLHLNALATSSKDHSIVKHETLTSGRQLIVSSSAGPYLSTIDSQEPVNKPLALSTSDRETDTAENGLQVPEDTSQTSAYVISEELNQSSPKKKRRRLEQGGETEGCKRCNCKKSKCLKLYCECFAAGVYCVEPCSCQECFNKPIHEDTVLATRKQIESRNPLAFAPKVIRSSDSMPEVGDEPSKTPASARHKRGCNCKKSSCLKKYCECYQGGVGCSINCRCEGCKNAFGRKDGSALTEAEPEEEAETLEKSVVDKNLQKSTLQNDEEYLDSALPVTPLTTCRQSSQLPFSSKSKQLPRSSYLTIGSSSGLRTSQMFGKPNFALPQPQSMLEKKFQTIPEDEMPEILGGNCSPPSSIKTTSPNSKRVSPPHCDYGSSPSRKSGRKLILQSIPSFPSLTPQH